MGLILLVLLSLHKLILKHFFLIISFNDVLSQETIDNYNFKNDSHTLDDYLPSQHQFYESDRRVSACFNKFKSLLRLKELIDLHSRNIIQIFVLFSCVALLMFLRETLYCLLKVRSVKYAV